MRRRNIITTAIVGGVVAAALVVTPSLTAFAHDGAKQDTGQSTRSSQAHDRSDGASAGRPDGSGQGMSHGAGKGKGDGMRSGNGSDTGSEQRHKKGSEKGHKTGSGLSDVPSGTVTAEQKAVLTGMAAEEKLAHDLYIAFADQYDERVFSRVANAEAKHQEAVRALLDRYDVTDPTVGLEAGQFPTESTQELYDSLLAQGSASIEAALDAARTVEKTDIADLAEAVDGVTAPDVLNVYERLLAGSERHLVAFGG